MKHKVVFVIVLYIFIPGSLVSSAEQLGLTALTSMERTDQDQQPYGAAEVEIKSAKNEIESFQVVVAAPKENIKVVKVAISDLIGIKGSKIGKEHIKLFRAEYVRVRRSTPRAELGPGLYPDPLVPFINPQTGKPIEPRRQFTKRWGEPTTTVGHEMYAVPFEVFKKQNQSIWVDVYVPKNVPAGIYKGKFTITAAGNISGKIPVTLTVWDFTLPDGPTHKNHFGGFYNISRYFDVKRNSDEFKKIEMRYCQAMADNRINPPIPRRMLPEVKSDGSLNIIEERHKALREFIDKFNVTDFEIPRAPFFSLPRSTLKDDYKRIPLAAREKAIRYYRQFYEYLKKNGWEKRAYLYMLDEPNLRENYEQVLVLGRLVHEAVPELKCLVVEQTYLQDPSWADIDPAVDIWCPLWSFIDE
ncbi:MAG: glycoside hydrolase domain-containing protein, partial [Planctomycetota bacterium]